MKAICRNSYKSVMHKTAVFQLLNIEVVLISAFLTNVYINKYFVVVVVVGGAVGLSFSTLRYMC